MPLTVSPQEAYKYLSDYGWIAPVEWDPRKPHASAPIPDGLGWDDLLELLLDALRFLLGTPSDRIPGGLSGMLQRQRCRVPDRIARPMGAGLCKWPHTGIRYHVSDAITLRNVPAETVARCWRAAWQSWADVCGIEPVEVADRGESNVWAASGRIDGPSGVLAWSMLPCGMPSNGQCEQRYDSGDNYTDPQFLTAVMAHEIGHALGLDHDAAGTLMAPYADRNVWRPQPGDIARVRQRYGPPRGTTPPTPTPDPVPTPTPGGPTGWPKRFIVTPEWN